MFGADNIDDIGRSDWPQLKKKAVELLARQYRETYRMAKVLFIDDTKDNVDVHDNNKYNITAHWLQNHGDLTEIDEQLKKFDKDPLLAVFDFDQTLIAGHTGGKPNVTELHPAGTRHLMNQRNEIVATHDDLLKLGLFLRKVSLHRSWQVKVLTRGLAKDVQHVIDFSASLADGKK